MSAAQDDPAYIEHVKARAEELDRVLNELSSRLRNMRERNRRAQEEIAGFQKELDEHHDWLLDRL